MRVYIIGSNPLMDAMFQNAGWEVVDSFNHADLIQFTGGSDVDPSLYGQQAHPTTSSLIIRDKREQVYFLNARDRGLPMAGICRGGQFLNVMCGGSLWQDVTGHTRDHIAFDKTTNTDLIVTSTHHQMMIPAYRVTKFEVLLTASEAQWKEKMRGPNSINKKPIRVSEKTPDIEAVFYPKERCLCFQPHPEFEKEGELVDLYFRYLNSFLMTR